MTGETINAESTTTQPERIILFYKYHPLSPDKDVTEIYRKSLATLCESLHLKGRILVGCSKTEGLNGTLSGDYLSVLHFTYALLGDREKLCKDEGDGNKERRQSVNRFWTESKAFFEKIGESELRFNSPEDFKWSVADESEKHSLFPDLNIKLVSELIGSGGIMSSISLEETAKGYLTPKEWHDRLAELRSKDKETEDDTILIDCRNTKEYEIGRFEGAMDPNTTTFSQFPKWVEDHSHLLQNKKVMMYCTGGIRCEKASAFIRKVVPAVKEVSHLKGGIHKYLEEFGGNDGGLWKGRNFVFDGRVAASAEETKLGKDGSIAEGEDANHRRNNHDNIVGKCVNCSKPYDRFDPRCVCTVCREPTLACQECQSKLIEFHCKNHFHLRFCYFSNLDKFSEKDLKQQLHGLEMELQEISVGRRFRQKRKTLLKQIEKVQDSLETFNDNYRVAETNVHSKCRNCGDIECSGRCWGFFGLKRKDALNNQCDKTISSRLTNTSDRTHAFCKKLRQDTATPREISQLNLFAPPAVFRDPESGIRVPPCTTRLLQCNTKAKWCGESLLRVVQNEFIELSRPEVLEKVLANGLLRLNDDSVQPSDIADIQLKTSDKIGRLIHWHEAPVHVPEKIGVTVVKLPVEVIQEYSLDKIDNDPDVYVCNKPSSVPVNPAGPYFANSLTTLVEAQEGLEPNSLKTIHRTDRVTSGLTLCCKSSSVARVFFRSLSEGSVEKLYLAQVSGKFPASKSGSFQVQACDDVAKYQWDDEQQCFLVDAPIFTADVSNGIRTIDASGKAAKSLFHLLSYDEGSDSSIISCFPITGRNHQLRVHLQWLGFPIINDVQYGGRLDSNKADDISQKAIALMHTEIKRASNEKQCVGKLSNEDVFAAKKACICCNGGRDGILSSFTPAQLLREGHAINLHALKYNLKILPKKSKKDSNLVPSQVYLAEINFCVALPTWGQGLDLDAIAWLKQPYF